MAKGQRTKGNTKPSSSNRAAHLLASSSGTVPLIGFSSLAPSKSNEDGSETEFQLDSDFRMVLKKMSKKDSVTKVKALQEFADLCKEKDEDSIKGILPFWTKMYNKLCLDYDWRVRESTHKAHEVLVCRVGRNIAPYLKQIMPFWLTSQYDSYAPASSAAKSSFNSAFPPVKQPDVFVFTKDAIINYIKDFLFNQTPQTIDDPNVASPDEINAKFQRMTAACLQGLITLITTIPNTSLREIETMLSDLLNNGKFWKLAKHKDPIIRSNWYKLISCLLENIPNLACSNPDKICSLTLGCLDESDLLVASALWETVLLVLITIKDSWSHINFKKAFLPQLRHFLRQGGRGNASTLFPNLLPLFSKIPVDLLDDPILFYKDFFSSFRQGFLSAKSSSECNAIVNAYMECIRYFIMNSNKLLRSDDVNLVKDIINFEFAEILKYSFNENSFISSNLFYQKLCQLIGFLKKQSSQTEDKYFVLFTQIILLLKQTCLESLKTLQINSIKQISNFIVIFGDNQKQSEDKQMKKLRFRRESDEEAITSQTKLLSIWSNDLADNENVQDFLKVVTSEAIKLYDTEKSCELLVLIVNLIKLTSKKILSCILECEESEATTKLWNSHIQKWLQDQNDNQDIDNKIQQINSLVDIVFLLYFIEQDKEKLVLLNQLINMKEFYAIERILTIIVQQNNVKLNQWIKSDSAGFSIINQIRELIKQNLDLNVSRNDEDVLWKIVENCFTKNILKEKFIEQIINEFTGAIKSTGDSTNEKKVKSHLIDFTCKLASLLFANYQLFTLPSAKSLLVTMFSFNCDLSHPNQVLRDAWVKAIQVIIKSTGGYINEESVVQSLALIIKQKLRGNFKSNESVNITFDCASCLLLAVFDSLPSKDDESITNDKLILSILEFMFLSKLEWTQFESDCDKWIVHRNWLKGNILWNPNECTFIPKVVQPKDEYINSAILTTKIINFFIIKNEERKFSDEFIELTVLQLKHLFLANCLINDSSKDFQEFKDILNSIVKLTEYTDLKNKLIDILLELSKTNGLFYSVALKKFLETLPDNTTLDLKPDLENILYEEVIAFQQYSEFIHQDSISLLMNDSLNLFLCSQNYTEFKSIAHLTIFHSCLKQTKSDETVSIILDFLIGLKSKQIDLFYFDKKFQATQELQFCSLVIDIFDVIVNKFSNQLTQLQWDLILCSLTSWIINLLKQKSLLFENLPVLIIAIRSLKLTQTIAQTINFSDGIHLKNLIIEWNEFHAKNIYGILLPFVIEICETQHVQNDYNKKYIEIFLNYLANCIVHVPQVIFPEVCSGLTEKESLVSPISTLKAETFNLSSDKQRLINNFCPLLVFKNHQISLLSHEIILKGLPFILNDLKQSETTIEEEEETLLCPPQTILSLLLKTDQVVDAMLQEVAIGDCCCIVQANTDTFTYTLAYLLLWSIVLEIFTQLTDEMRSQYASFLKNSNLLSRLLENLFRLMPVVPANETESKVLNVFLPELFIPSKNSVSINETLDSFDIQKQSLYVYYLVLRKLPASARQWWNNLDKRTADVVNKFTSTYFSGHLCLLEVEAVNSVDISKFKNMTIKTRPAAREVLATYKVEDITIELLVQLPQNHPLGPINIDCGKRIGVSNTQWRNWLLQLTTFLTYQNGSILGGLLLWKRNVEKRFEGVEECMICFYVLHGATYQLPKLQCRTCKKRYHSACLYKWFSTSNNATCPLCRNLF